MSTPVPMYGFGGGGAALNFKVVPGLTQPGTAAENTIWVKTEKIGAWYFSATQPEGMQEWDVWFPTDTSSTVEFNALKKNGIQVYPIFAKQYVSGAWVEKTAKSYQGGKWVDWWNGELYKNGDEYIGFTGGWIAEQILNSTPTIVRNPTTMVIAQPDPGGSKTGIGRVKTANAIDITDYKNACCLVAGTGKWTKIDFVVIPEGGGDSASKLNLSSMSSDSSIAKNVYKLDISTLKNKHHIGFSMENGVKNVAMPLTIYEVYLTK